MPTTETDRELHQQAQDIHLALGAAIEYDDTSMLADAVATSRDLFFLHTLSDIDALWRSMFQIKRALKDELNPDLELLRRSREQASVVVAATDPDTPDVATGPFSAYITETIVHRVTVEQDFLDNLPHVIRQEDPTDLGVMSRDVVESVEGYAANRRVVSVVVVEVEPAGQRQASFGL